MKDHKYLLAVVLMVVVAGSAGQASGSAVYWEDGDGNSNTIADAVWTNIQTAINYAQGGVTTRGAVELSGDFHRDPATGGNCLYVTNTAGGAITISGGWDSGFTAQPWKAVWNATHDFTQEAGYSVLDANADASHRARAIRIDCSNIWVEGCVIENGYQPNVDSGLSPGDLSCRGAGIAAAGAGGAGLRLSHVVVTNNYTTGNYGAGFYVQDASDNAPVVIEYCRFSKNTAGGGMLSGGIFMSGGYRINVANCIFAGNSAGGGGHAIYFSAPGTRGVVFGSFFYANGFPGSTRGVVDGSMTWNVNLMNCTFADNYGYCHYVNSADWPYNTQIRNCLFASNSMGAISLKDTTRKNPFTDINRSGLLGRLILDDSSITNRTGSEPYWDEGGIQLDTDPKFMNRGLHPYSPHALSPAVTAVGPTNAAWPGQGVDSIGYLRVMTTAEKTGNLGAGASGCTVRYVNVESYGENVGGAPNAGYDAKLDVIVDLGGYTPTAQNYLDNYIYPWDLAGNPRVHRSGIHVGAYQAIMKRGTVISFR